MSANVSEQLGYEHRSPNAFHRRVRAFASTRPGAWVFSHTARSLDRAVLRVTRQRTTAATLLAGLRVVEVTTTGARSGVPRAVYLAGIPTGDGLALIGTNFGQHATPAWYHNLRANPEAQVSYRGRRARVRAREAAGAERDEIWRHAVETYAGYAAYDRRLRRRDVHVMVLEPAD